MSHVIMRRLGSMVTLIVIGFGLIASAPSDSIAKKRGAKSKKTSQSALGKKNAKRSAKSSRSGSAPMSQAEKAEMIEKIRQLSASYIVEEDSSTFTSAAIEGLNMDAELARAAQEELEEDDIDVSIEQFFKARPGSLDAESLDPEVTRARQLDFTLFDESDPVTVAKRSDVMAQIIDWLGTRYIFGGLGRSGIDCSAFTREVFRRTFGLSLPRTAHMQSMLGDKVEKDELQFGDLVFFHTANYAPVSHVGIYIGEGLFANAQSSKGVAIASLSSTYWKKRYLGAKRLLNNSAMASRPTENASSRMAFEGNGVFDPAE